MIYMNLTVEVKTCICGLCYNLAALSLTVSENTPSLETYFRVSGSAVRALSTAELIRAFLKLFPYLGLIEAKAKCPAVLIIM